MKKAGNVIKRRLQCNYRSRNYKVIVSVYNVSVIDGPPANYIPTHDDKGDSDFFLYNRVDCGRVVKEINAKVRTKIAF